MSLPAWQDGLLLLGFPRQRGDEPGRAFADQANTQFSPPARG